MDAKEFKRCYVKWSYAVAFAVPTLMMAVVLCDSLLGFDFSHDMYMMSFIATGCVLALLTITWISVLNAESRFMNRKPESIIDDVEPSSGQGEDQG